MQPNDALLIIDVQNDFCPGGSLAVAGGDEIVPVLNQYIEEFIRSQRPVFATRDWHPRNTKHFNTGGGPWPPHCVQGSKGAEFRADLALPRDAVVVSTGTGPDEEGYSGFEGRDNNGVELADLLRRARVARIFIGGLATDYCVKQTVLDARRRGFEIVLLEDAVRGVNVREGDSERAIAEMIAAGAMTSRLSDYNR